MTRGALFILALLVAAPVARAQSLVVEGAECEGPISEAAIRPLVALETGAPVGEPIEIAIELTSCDADVVRITIRHDGTTWEDRVSLEGVAPVARARAVALTIAALLAEPPAPAPEDPAPAAASAPSAVSFASALDAPAEAEEVAPPPSSDPSVELRWAVLGEARGATEGHEVAGGARVALGICLHFEGSVVYACARGDVGGALGVFENAAEPLAHATGGVTLEAGARLDPAVRLELGTRIEFSYASALNPNFRIAMGSPTQLLLGGVLRAGVAPPRATVGFIAEVEVTAVLTHSTYWDFAAGLRGAQLIARLGVGL